MADKIYGLSEADVLVLRDIKKWFKSTTQNGAANQRTRREGEDDQSPEVYLALIPYSGISGIVTRYGAEIVQSAECSILRITQSQIGTGDGSAMSSDYYPVIEVLPLTQIVFNPSTKSVPGGQKVPVWRDKYGQWMTVGGVMSTADSSGSTAGMTQMTVVTDISCDGNTLVVTKKCIVGVFRVYNEVCDGRV